MSRDGAILCVVLGGGGHARVIVDCLVTSDTARPVAILDTNSSLWGKTVLGVPIVGGDERLAGMKSQGVTHFVVGVGSVGNNQPRARLFDLGLDSKLEPITVMHPASVCSTWASVGAGSVLFPGSVVNSGATLGKNVIVNSGAIIEHDCQVGDHVHVASRACLCSTVRVGDYAHIGAGTTVRQCLAIGVGAVVAAGAAVVEDVPPWTVVAGVPAKVLKRIQSWELKTRPHGFRRTRA